MSIWNDWIKNLVYRGNKPLTVGIIWSIFGITICPCPLCLIGSMSFLIFGIADKLGLTRYIHVKTIETHEHSNCKCAHDLGKHQIIK